MIKLRKKVVAIIFNKDGKILIWKYSSDYFNWSILHQSNWTFPGWWKEYSENYKESLFREIHEEVWILPNKLEIIYKYKNFFYKRYSSITQKWFVKYRHKSFRWKKQKTFILKFNWDNKNINLGITDEFWKYKWVYVNELSNYIDNRFIDFIDIAFLNGVIAKNCNLFK